jgi:hypothetical protein
MSQQLEPKVEASREFLEGVPAEKLTDGQHIALAIHRIGDLFEEYLESVLQYEEDEE